MRHTEQLKELEFTPSKVKVTDWDLRIPIAPKAGPFCQLVVEPSTAAGPGLFAWVVADKVVYLGHTDDLASVSNTHGDYSVVSPSTTDGGPATINNLMNAAHKAEHRVSWWWRQETTADDAAQAAEGLVAELDPMGNKLTRPKAAPVKAQALPAAAATRTPRVAATPKAKAPVKYDAERVTPTGLVCPSCFIRVSLATRWCDDCEILVAS
ncbi:hypothetical protein [Tessaracoccus sp. MC1756]|uniref:hypothetical protein n=1 Tax=Tessaracoccus sp. MC1756 TaxID=2760311 RepID=UPI001603AE85|nr:hypothetical protein [Tessaracoccus sp. MC1756]MBB1509616.1 hypothetical protein [Tessaracoccus sp. MC1756]